MAKSRAKAEEEEKKKLKKERIRKALILAAIGLAVLIIYLIIACMPLDEMTDYRVHVTPQDDGSLEITYSYEWKVLNDSKEGPLSWVKLGMANPNYVVKEFGGSAGGIRYQPSESSENPMLELNLDRSYYKGETARFWFTVHQRNMLCENSADPEEPFYDFTPGWFDEMRVKHYEFTWEQRRNILTHNADRTEDGDLVWEGALKKGESRQMKLTCALEGFRRPELVVWREYRNGVEGDSPIVGAITIVLFFGALCAVFGFLGDSDQSHYNGGRGYHGYHGPRSGGGGCACACACAGCACACACAGGGRAGCSKKDFYHTADKKEEK